MKEASGALSASALALVATLQVPQDLGVAKGAILIQSCGASGHPPSTVAYVLCRRRLRSSSAD